MRKYRCSAKGRPTEFIEVPKTERPQRTAASIYAKRHGVMLKEVEALQATCARGHVQDEGAVIVRSNNTTECRACSAITKRMHYERTQERRV